MNVTTDETVAHCCEACSDTGWQSFSCGGRSQPICGRRRLHEAHEFARPCPCRPINRNYQDRLQALRRAS